MLNMRFGGSPILYRKLGVLHLSGITKKDCYYNDSDKRSEELSEPYHLCSLIQKSCSCFWENFHIGFKV